MYHKSITWIAAILNIGFCQSYSEGKVPPELYHILLSYSYIRTLLQRDSTNYVTTRL